MFTQNVYLYDYSELILSPPRTTLPLTAICIPYGDPWQQLKPFVTVEARALTALTQELSVSLPAPLSLVHSPPGPRVLQVTGVDVF